MSLETEGADQQNVNDNYDEPAHNQTADNTANLRNTGINETPVIGNADEQGGVQPHQQDTISTKNAQQPVDISPPSTSHSLSTRETPLNGNADNLSSRIQSVPRMHNSQQTYLPQAKVMA